MLCCSIGAVLLYALLLWNLITPAMRIRSFRSGAKQGLFSAGGVLLTFSFLMSLFMHVVIVVAIGYHSVYLTTAPLLLASSVIFLAKSCVDKQFRTWRLGPKLTHCLISSIFPVTTPRPQSDGQSGQSGEHCKDQDGRKRVVICLPSPLGHPDPRYGSFCCAECRS